MRKAVKLLGCIALAQAAGIIGSAFTIPEIPGWYAQINKPSFNPPSWVFSPVWITLYTLMGVALFLVLQKEKIPPHERSRAIIIFGVQLVLNAFWSIVFFGMHSLLGGLIVILLLWLAIAFTIKAFYGISKPAGLLLIPYILWVTYAALLNAAFVVLNR